MEIAVPARSAAPAAHASRLTASSALAVPLFGTAMLLSGFLLFLIEPMIARMVLPILGGVPMVWNGCVVFFQIVMLAGYGYAFGASRWLAVRHHVLVHAALLLAPVAVLPVMIKAGTVQPPAGNPLGWLLLLLAATVGLPFFVLSTTASVLQHWLSRTDHPSGRDPYFLYAASNVGCLLALASYPTLVEPALSVRDQSRLWAFGYGAFALLAAGCGVYAWRRQASGVRDAAVELGSAPLTLERRGRWIALAFIPSSLMLAVTSYVSTDIAAVPLLWILPLALYLATFALAFGRASSRAAAVATRALPLLVVPLALFMIARVREPLAAILLLHFGAFGAIALYCHTALSADRPDRGHLTEFYFWLSFGGMLGGLFNTLVAPLLFNSVAEYPLVVMLAALFFRVASPQPWRGVRDAVPAAAAGTLTAAVLVLTAKFGIRLSLELAALGVPALIAFSQRRHGWRFGSAVAAMLAATLAFGAPAGRLLSATRTFFGVYRVSEDSSGRYHGLAHGTTLHGIQSTAPARQSEALTYFHSTGPFGDAWRSLPGARGRAIAVIGLGIGTLASYAAPDQQWTFFEIDPAIERIARTPSSFTFLERCGERCHVVVGDARLSLARMPEQAYDLLILDAFSSDSIPVHLMTREAVALYRSRLAPGGALVMHISNRHLRLAPIVARLAADSGLYAAQRLDPGGSGGPEGKSGSHWVVLAQNASDVTPLIAAAHWTPLQPSASTPLWTDDFSNILSVLSFR